jgi:hypothetical protein
MVLSLITLSGIVPLSDGQLFKCKYNRKESHHQNVLWVHTDTRSKEPRISLIQYLSRTKSRRKERENIKASDIYPKELMLIPKDDFITQNMLISSSSERYITSMANLGAKLTNGVC